MNIVKSELIANDSILLRRIYIDILGDVYTALILSQIIYWNLPDKNGRLRLRVNR
jgi:hypothetical protein